MATNSNDLQRTILEAVDTIVKQRTKELKLDKTITAIIKKSLGIRYSDGCPLYQVEYDGGVFNAIAQERDSYTKQTKVYVLVPEGNFSNEKLILGRASIIQTGRDKSVISAAVNNYSITGSNLLKGNSSEQFGLYSYHKTNSGDHAENHTDHWAKFLYKYDEDNNLINFNNDNFKEYINADEVSAIMIRADFLTRLAFEQKQQTNAHYGLIFNIAFDNLNAGYGETQGEILNNISKLIKDTTSNLYELIHTYLNENKFEDKTINNWVSDNTGYLDRLLEYGYQLYENAKKSNPELEKEIVVNTIQAFFNLLNELKQEKTVTDIQQTWQEWQNIIIGESAQKIEQFVLDSNNMLGNPLNFNEWNSQYAVFSTDFTNFNHIDSILFYKEGFVEDNDKEELNNPDIYVRNLQFYAMNPLDAQSGDYSLKIEPLNNYDIILSNSSLKETQLKATFLRKNYENLTANSSTNVMWFKEDSSVNNVKNADYNYLAGLGWKQIPSPHISYYFITTLAENKAYKNNYKCVINYKPNEDESVILSKTFYILNKDQKIDIQLESDIGTSFSFDAGSPIITAKINTEANTEIGTFKELESEEYQYIWTITDATNDYILFLNEAYQSELSSNGMMLAAKEKLRKNIKLYNLSNNKRILLNNEIADNSKKASSIQYPVSTGSSGFTVNCYLQHKDSEDGEFYDVGSASLEFTNSQSTITSEYQIQIINGNQVFQYDEYGNTPTAQKQKDPLEIKTLQAKLLTPSGIEVQDTNYQVEWICPIENTMLQISDSLSLNAASGLIQNHYGPQLSFTIADLYDPDAYDNQITCHIYFSNKDYYKDTDFYFGKQGNNGTNGTDVVAKINVRDTKNIPVNQPLILYTQDNNTKGMLNNTIQTPANSISITPNILELKLYQKNKEISPANSILWNLAGNNTKASTIERKIGKVFSLQAQAEGTTINNLLKWNPQSTATATTTNNFLLQHIKAETQVEQQTYYAFFSLPIIEYKNTDESFNLNTLLSKNRIGIDKRFWLKEVVYNQDGRNPVYNHNQGLKLINLPPTLGRIEFQAKGGWTENENKPEENENKPDFQLIGETTITGPFENNECMIYVLPNDTFNGSHTNNRIEAYLYNNDDENEPMAIVYAPIYMSLNTFGLTSLNAWDGNTVQIDEDNGYVMAPQIGAGEKDSNNRFTGILMGKTETYTGGSGNKEEIGLFGYSHGLQSIFLDSKTGNAIFGLPDPDTEYDSQGNVIGYKYKNSNQTTQDNYGEGRIELRPGGESKIGGWRLGRQSFYYITDNNNDLKEIDKAYTDVYAKKSQHKKDINHDDKGILLNAAPFPYISIKGRPLSVGNNNDYDINDSSGNAALENGDSLELNLDPNQASFFTMFRHYKKDSGEWDRTPLVGIDALGRFYTNALQDQETSLNMNYVEGFGNRAIDKQYIGLNIGYGTDSIFKAFVKEGAIDTDTVYLTGGKLDNEYARALSLHGKSVLLYANTNTNSTSPDVDANIQLHSDEVQIQLHNTKLDLTKESDNELVTRGSLDIQLGYDNKDSVRTSAIYVRLISKDVSKKYKLNDETQKFYLCDSSGNVTEEILPTLAENEQLIQEDFTNFYYIGIFSTDNYYVYDSITQKYYECNQDYELITDENNDFIVLNDQSIINQLIPLSKILQIYAKKEAIIDYSDELYKQVTNYYQYNLDNNDFIYLNEEKILVTNDQINNLIPLSSIEEDLYQYVSLSDKFYKIDENEINYYEYDTEMDNYVLDNNGNQIKMPNLQNNQFLELMENGLYQIQQRNLSSIVYQQKEYSEGYYLFDNENQHYILDDEFFEWISMPFLNDNQKLVSLNEDELYQIETTNESLSSDYYIFEFSSDNNDWVYYKWNINTNTYSLDENEEKIIYNKLADEEFIAKDIVEIENVSYSIGQMQQIQITYSSNFYKYSLRENFYCQWNSLNNIPILESGYYIIDTINNENQKWIQNSNELYQIETITIVSNKFYKIDEDSINYYEYNPQTQNYTLSNGNKIKVPVLESNQDLILNNDNDLYQIQTRLYYKQENDYYLCDSNGDFILDNLNNKQEAILNINTQFWDEQNNFIFKIGTFRIVENLNQYYKYDEINQKYRECDINGNFMNEDLIELDPIYQFIQTVANKNDIYNIITIATIVNETPYYICQYENSFYEYDIENQKILTNVVINQDKKESFVKDFFLRTSELFTFYSYYRHPLNIQGSTLFESFYANNRNLYTQKINEKGIFIDTENNYKLSSNKGYQLSLKHSLLDIEYENNYLIKLGFKTNDRYKNLIELNQNKGYWKTNGEIQLNTKSKLWLQDFNIGNGNNYNWNNPQILIQAGTGTDYKASLVLNTSNNSWSHRNTNTAEMNYGDLTNSWFRVYNNYKTKTGSGSQGIYLYDSIENNTSFTYFGINAKETKINGDITVQKKYYGASKNAFCDTSKSIAYTLSGLGNSRTGTFTYVTLGANGRPQLSTRTMKVTIPSATTIYNAIKNSIASQINNALSNYATKSALNSYAKKSDLNKYVKTGKTYTLKGPLHTITGDTAWTEVTIDGKTVSHITSSRGFSPNSFYITT